MSSLDSQHHERFEQMKSEVSRRKVDWWFYLPKEVDSDLKVIVEFLKTQFLHVGPFGKCFISDTADEIKTEFYSMPLDYRFPVSDKDDSHCVAFVATNDSATIILKNIAEYLKTQNGYEAFEKLGMVAMCVQTAENEGHRTMVVAIDVLENIQPIVHYEHPPNGRLLMAMSGNIVPDRSALVMGCSIRQPNCHIQATLNKATIFYNDLERGEYDQNELAALLYTLYQQ